ncbi:uncharacterized protein LOC120165094 [Hibiscus syriacus]|nr:uncharacterized protein LOC120165094 [Hibiscus syriacus]
MRGIKARTNFVYPATEPHSASDHFLPPFTFSKQSQSSSRDINCIRHQFGQSSNWSSLANQHSGDFSVGSSAQRNDSPNMVLFRNLLNSSNSSLQAPPPQSLADYIPLIHGNASSSSFSLTFPANSSILPCASLLKSFTNNITRSATDSFTGTTMTHTLKETVDDMEFFPQKPSDSGLLQEIIQGFLPKKSGERKVTTNCTQHSIAVPVESFGGVTGSESVPYANEVPTKYLQVGQDFLLYDIFQYPDFMGALPARVQNA